MYKLVTRESQSWENRAHIRIIQNTVERDENIENGDKIKDMKYKMRWSNIHSINSLRKRENGLSR